MKRVVTLLTVSTTLLSLTACGPVKTPKMASYALDRPATKVLSQRPRNVTILVNTVQASPTIAGQEMLYQQKPYEVRAFAHNQWIAPPASMMTDLIVESLRHSHAFANVVTSPFSGHYDYRVDVQLNTLQQDFRKQPSQIHLVLSAQVLQRKHKRIIASQTFAEDEASPSDDPYGGVLAANKATQTALTKLTRFVRVVAR